MWVSKPSMLTVSNKFASSLSVTNSSASTDSCRRVFGSLDAGGGRWVEPHKMIWRIVPGIVLSVMI